MVTAHRYFRGQSTKWRGLNNSMLTIESEIGFRFKSRCQRDADYSRQEVSDAVEAFAAISCSIALRPYKAQSVRELQTASSGGCCWRGARELAVYDFASGRELNIDGSNIANNVGTPNGDPRSVVALVNILREGAGVQAGEIMITGMDRRQIC